MILDMATSLVAEGKVAIAATRGTTLPEGAIVDKEGIIAAEPAAFYDGGSLLPAAGHKGFGLAAMVEALSVSLTGAGESRPAEGALVICIDAGGFRPESDVRASIEALRSRLHASGRECAVLAPGEPEARARADSGSVILVETAVLTRLRRLASEVP